MTTVLLVFAIVYLGMILGGLPLFQLDRTGIALLGAIVLVATGDVSLEAAGRSEGEGCLTPWLDMLLVAG